MPKFKTLKDHVYDFIAEEILSGGLKTNQKIDENAICEELSISRTPVREALIQLAGDGILENVPRKGYVVKGLTLGDVENLYTVIGCLDALAAVHAQPNLTDKDYKDMQFYIDSMDVAISSGHYEMYNKLQQEFHSAYINKCKNDLLVAELTKLQSKLLNSPYSAEDVDILKNVLKKTNDEHRNIIKLFKSADLDNLGSYIATTHWSISNAIYDLVE